jgi:hypothetical protein
MCCTAGGLCGAVCCQSGLPASIHRIIQLGVGSCCCVIRTDGFRFQSLKAGGHTAWPKGIDTQGGLIRSVSMNFQLLYEPM